MKFSIKDLFDKCDQNPDGGRYHIEPSCSANQWTGFYMITASVRIWSHLPKKSLMENFIICAMNERYRLNLLN